MTGDSAQAQANSSGIVDLRDLLATSGVQGDCHEDSHNGVAFFHQALRDATAFDFLGKQLGTSCSPFTGSLQRVVS